MTEPPSISRRALAAAATSIVVPSSAQAQAQAQGPAAAPSAATPLVVAMLVHPDMVLLDLAGPQTVFALMGAKIHLVGRTMDPVTTDIGLRVHPDVDYAACPARPDVLFVPGGLKGSVALMNDDDTLAFLSATGATAGYVTSVCTGALVLGAAGLLRGYRATTHWYVHDMLASLGARPERGRVVVDRNRITGGGVTAGLDFGLVLAARLVGEMQARRIQLVLEYDPQPPFASGSPDGAGPDLTQDVLRRRAPALQAARAATLRAAGRLGI